MPAGAGWPVPALAASHLRHSPAVAAFLQFAIAANAQARCALGTAGAVISTRWSKYSTAPSYGCLRPPQPCDAW
eukprot:5273828-Prymnesium_polylepis.1